MTKQRVLCAWCGEDYTDSTQSGGFIFQTSFRIYPTGPCCEAKIRQKVIAEEEERFVTSRCPRGEAFRDYILKIRNAHPHIEHALMDGVVIEEAAKEIFAEEQPKNGALLICEERKRQIAEEGYTSANDDFYTHDELLRAADCYIKAGRGLLASCFVNPHAGMAPSVWPWNKEFWKPLKPDLAGKIRNLTKAGALIAAEIDRLERLQKTVAKS